MTTHGHMPIYTIGHSTLSGSEFIERLEAFKIQILADIRSFPGSRRWPQFNREPLAAALHEHKIEYVWLPKLGGRRKSGLGDESPNTAWQHPSFRNYADHMLTPEFRAGLQELLDLAARGTTAIMCAEAVPWRCHRSLIADALTARGYEVLDIMSATRATPHVLTPMARVHGQQVAYPAEVEGAKKKG